MPDNCGDLPYPAMFLDDTVTGEMDDFYNKNHAKVIGGIVDRLFFKKAEVKKMVDYFDTYPWPGGVKVTALRFYFACFGPVGSPGLPDPKLAGRFTFIFAPAIFHRAPNGAPPFKASATDVGPYYLVLSGGTFDPANPLSQPIFDALTTNWSRDYLLPAGGSPKPRLPIDPDDDNNSTPPPGTKVYTETKAVFYTMVNFKELVSEIDCSGAGGLSISLSAHPAGEPRLKKRLTTLFKLADSDGNPWVREKELIDKRKKRPNFLSSYDTGIPCPPYTGCPPPVPPLK